MQTARVVRDQEVRGDTLVRVLGPVSATVAGRDCPVSSPMLRALLAVLALDAGRVVPVDRLLSELWGETPAPSVASSLQVYVSRLRRALGDAADLDTAAPPVRVRIFGCPTEALRRRPWRGR